MNIFEQNFPAFAVICMDKSHQSERASAFQVSEPRFLLLESPGLLLLGNPKFLRHLSFISLLSNRTCWDSQAEVHLSVFTSYLFLHLNELAGEIEGSEQKKNMNSETRAVWQSQQRGLFLYANGCKFIPRHSGTPIIYEQVREGKCYSSHREEYSHLKGTTQGRILIKTCPLCIQPIPIAIISKQIQIVLFSSIIWKRFDLFAAPKKSS